MKAKIGKKNPYVYLSRKHIFGICKHREIRDVSKNCGSSEFIQCGLSMVDPCPFYCIKKGYGLELVCMDQPIR